MFKYTQKACTVVNQHCLAPADGEKNARCTCIICGNPVCKNCSLVLSKKRMCHNCIEGIDGNSYRVLEHIYVQSRYFIEDFPAYWAQWYDENRKVKNEN